MANPLNDMESQYILRVPPEIAVKLNAELERRNVSENFVTKSLKLTPFIEPDQNQNEELKFKYLISTRFKFCDFESRASVIDLPTITESYKTKDSINMFKSNSINQMILVHPNGEKSIEDFPKPLKVAKKFIRKINNRRVVQYKAPSGLTAPTKYIRKRFFRKEVQVDVNEVQRVEVKLSDIIKDLTKQKNDIENGSKEEDKEIGMAKPKRRYRKKF